ncbi:hypothetical protein H7347_06830 [Corynebacterium sp. zg-331]|uniref:hypothetical protein n=1 Tax=unclassified Corynebacterium TaxID=2624378 RepID=UPI00128B0A99|nr:MULTISPECIES: hypothetical protein [unclassified Corynebacterium]MBC3186286.1 hypothetical protein [Corynebacterium sp. zg-331]MPV52775.1 hypothetical protein [Corynebacterium sp. zg331]
MITLIRTTRHGDAIYAHLTGEDEPWGLTEQLLAAAVDALNGANWQRSGGKAHTKPKPIPRPGIRSHGTPTAARREAPQGDPFKEEESGVFMGVPTPVDALNTWLGWE